MRLKDINAEITCELWMKPELAGESPNMGVGYLSPDNGGQAYRLRIDGQQWNVLLRDASAGKDLNYYLKRHISSHIVEQAVPPRQFDAANSPNQDSLMQRAHRISLMQSSDAVGFAASWAFDGLMQAGSPLRGVLM